jgi:hypothetical protein
VNINLKEPAEASTSTDQDSLILKENKNTRKNGTLLLMNTLGKKTVLGVLIPQVKKSNKRYSCDKSLDATSLSSEILRRVKII